MLNVSIECTCKDCGCWDADDIRCLVDGVEFAWCEAIECETDAEFFCEYGYLRKEVR